MLDAKEVNIIERVVQLLKHNSKDPAPVRMLEAMLNETEDAVTKSTPKSIMDIIPKVLNRLKKELRYGSKDNISTESVQRDKDRASHHGDEWTPSQ